MSGRADTQAREAGERSAWKRTLRVLGLLAALALSGAALSFGQDASFDDRLHALRAEAGPELDGLLGQGERAARELARRHAEGEEAGTERAYAIAEGVLSVAEARVALRAARAEVAALERDLAHVRARRAQSEAALEAARRTRDQPLPEPEPIEEPAP